MFVCVSRINNDNMQLPMLFPGMKTELVFENPTSLFDGSQLRLRVVIALLRYCINQHEKVWNGTGWAEPSPCSMELYFDVFGELFSIIDFCSVVVKDWYDIVFHIDDYGRRYVEFAYSIDWFRLERLQYGKLWVEVFDVLVNRSKRDQHTGEYICLVTFQGEVLSRYIESSIRFEVNTDNRALFSVPSGDRFKLSMKNVVKEGTCYSSFSSNGLFYAFTECCLDGNWSIMPCFNGGEEYYCEEEKKDREMWNWFIHVI